MVSAATPADFGRVDPDGTVYVITAEGERSVGQIPDADPAEALAFFTHRFGALEVEVGLLEERLKRGAIGPDDARKSIENQRKSITGANAVGDLAGLLTRLDALAPVLAEATQARKEEKAKASAAANQAKEAMVAEAEKIAEGKDWGGGVNRFRALLTDWKALPRIDRATDDDLWHRFSTARTTYTRRRKAQFAEQAEKRGEAKAAKEKIIAEARTLASSTEWGPTAGAFRDLMSRWKEAGPAPRDVDDKLWAEFRGIQDEFFNARTAALSEQDAEFSGNLEAKQALLEKAEAEILPITDLAAARALFRDFLAAYNARGKVPRDAIRPLEGRVRALEEAVKSAEESEWSRTNPENRERATGTATLLQDQINKLVEKLAKAETKGDTSTVAATKASIATYESWLAQANKTLQDFSR